MYPFRIPKAFCNQSVKIVLNGNKEDLYGNKEELPPIEIDNCLFQLETIYTGGNNNRMKVADGTLFFLTVFLVRFLIFR